LTQTDHMTIDTQPGHRHLAEVCAAHRLSRAELKGPIKLRIFTRGRQDFWFRLMVIERTFSYPEVARMSGDRDHTTVLYGVRKFASRHLRTPETARIEEIRSAWQGYQTAMEFARALWSAPVADRGEYGNNLEAMGLAA
jgi:hypothetical protein